MKVYWNTAEKNDLTVACVARMAELGRVPPTSLTKADVMATTDFFDDVLGNAQLKVFMLKPHRMRRVATHSQVPWLVTSILQHIAELKSRDAVNEVAEQPKLTMQMAFDPATLDAFVEALAPRIAERVAILIGRSVVQPVVISTKENQVAKERVPSVVVYGLLAAQQHHVTKDWGTKFKLLFIEDDKRKADYRSVDYAVGLTSFMSHSADRHLQTAFKENYTRVTGGVSSVKKALSDLYARIGRSRV